MLFRIYKIVFLRFDFLGTDTIVIQSEARLLTPDVD